jgi:15-cis-phytoene synthase
MTRRSAQDPSNETVVWDAARTGDIDRYLAALLAPRQARGDLVALAAFLGEVARIPDAVSEPMMSDIRLQWWRDALASLSAGEVTGSPVADSLGGVIARHALPKALLLSVVDARARNFEHPRHALAARSEDLTAYLAETEGAAFRLSVRVLGIEESPALFDLLAAAAQAYGRARFARSLVQGGGSDREELHQEARAWLAETRRRAPAAPAAVLPAILPIALVEPYLAALEGAGPEITGEGAGISPLTRVWRLWWAKTRRRI